MITNDKQARPMSLYVRPRVRPRWLWGVLITGALGSGCFAAPDADSPDGATSDDAPASDSGGSSTAATPTSAATQGGTESSGGGRETQDPTDALETGDSSSGGEGSADFDPTTVASCADVDLEGVCIDVFNAEELIATRNTCPYHEPCRVVVHPGTYMIGESNFTHHHWYRHFIGVSVETGERPTIFSTGTSVFANKGHQEYQQNIILQNLVLSGPSMGVDFDGASGEPWLNKGGLSWLDRVKIDVDGPGIFFNSSPDGGGSGALWCTSCDLIRGENAAQVVMVGSIDSAWFSDTIWNADEVSHWTVRVFAKSIGLDGVVDREGDDVACADIDVECGGGPNEQWLRPPTLEWFESLVLAQDHEPTE